MGWAIRIYVILVVIGSVGSVVTGSGDWGTLVVGGLFIIPAIGWMVYKGYREEVN